MTPSLVHFRAVARRRQGWLIRTAAAGLAVAALAWLGALPARAAGGEGTKEGLVEQGQADPRLKGYYAPRGFKVRVVASGPALGSPSAMAFDDAGQLYVAEWQPSDREFETRDSLALPEGGTARVRRRRKGTTDLVKRLRDADGDGTYESAEVVVDGVEMPAGVLPWKNSLYLTCVGRLERWADEDGDGKFETRTVLADGFSADGRHGLSGMTLGADGWLYLTAGDGDHHVVGPDGSRVELARTGGVFRCRPDGSKLQVFAIGLCNPHGQVAFDAAFAPFLIDDDGRDGSRFQGTRLVAPVEAGDYGWRARPGAPAGVADFDRAAVDGERPGKLAVLARDGRGAAVGLVDSSGTSLPPAWRDLLIAADPARRTVLGRRVEPKGGSYVARGETTLMVADDDRFHPGPAVVGADGALYILDSRGGVGGEGGRLYRLTWEGDGVTPAPPARPNNWQRIFAASGDALSSQFLAGPDHAEAARAQRELIDRGAVNLKVLLAYASGAGFPLHARLLGLQGARQLWSDEVEAAMIGLLADAQPEVRRLALQAIAWEPRAANSRLVPRLIEKLDDPDGRVVREAALAIGHHAEGRPQQAAAVMLRWLYAHPKADPVVRDGVVRGLERLGEAGVEEVALAVRTRRGVDRAAAVALFTGLRSAAAAEQLGGLAKIPDLAAPERLALVRMFPEIPLDVPASTNGLALFVANHPDLDPAIKLAALDACRLAGNPASGLILGLLEDDDAAVRIAATALAGRSRPPGAMKTLAGRLSDADRTAPERLAIVRALRGAGPTAFGAIDAACLASEDVDFRLAALRSLADVDRAKATPALQGAVTGPNPALQAEAVRILAEAPATALLLGRSHLDRSLPRASLPGVLAALRKHDGPEHRRLLAAIEADGSVGGPTAIDPAEVRARALKGADPWSGLGVFFRDTPARCSGCHQVGGLDAGPAEKLVDVILRHPKVGRTPAGKLAAGGPEARTVSLASSNPGRADGPSARPAPRDRPDSTSLRPERAALELAPDDLSDLAAFLASKPARAALDHGPRRLDRVLVVGPLEPGADKLRAPLDKVDPARPLPGQGGEPATWAAIDATDAGVFNLRGQFGSQPGRAYLSVQVRSDRDQAAALRFGSEGAARVYLNGAKVADVAARDPAILAPAFARPPGGELAPLPDLARLALRAGWNLVVVALDRPADDSALAAFEVASPEPVELRAPKN